MSVDHDSLVEGMVVISSDGHQVGHVVAVLHALPEASDFDPGQLLVQDSKAMGLRKRYFGFPFAALLEVDVASHAVRTSLSRDECESLEEASLEEWQDRVRPRRVPLE